MTRSRVHALPVIWSCPKKRRCALHVSTPEALQHKAHTGTPLFLSSSLSLFLSLSFSFSLSLFLSSCLSLFLSFSLSLFISLFLFLFLFLSFSLSVSLLLSPSFSFSLFLSCSLSVFLSLFLSLSLLTCLTRLCAFALLIMEVDSGCGAAVRRRQRRLRHWLRHK